MSFQAYLDNIKTKTVKTPEDFKKQLEKEKLLNPEMRASELVRWLKDKFNLGHGHSMAVWAVFKSKGWVKDTKMK